MCVYVYIYIYIYTYTHTYRYSTEQLCIHTHKHAAGMMPFGMPGMQRTNTSSNGNIDCNSI